jgi:solute carrier family 34 (sodium-dependent phosphate cotransporter)
LDDSAKRGRNKISWFFERGRESNLFVILKPVGILFFLYIFILSITLLGDGFKLFGKGFAETLLNTTSNPLVGLFIGILATSIIQSSSTTTSILVGMVASGVISFESAIPIVMGANIGTTITNTLVSLTHIARTHEFRRAFAGAIVHDIFNLLSVLVLFPLQYFTNFLGIAADWLAQLFESAGGLSFASPIKIITKPVVHEIVIFLGHSPWLTVLISIVLLFAALKFIVDIMKSLVLSRVEGFFDKYIFKTTFRALTLGILLTAVVQSSSITTSIIVPLIGAGVLTLRQVFPYTLGANLGTTVTAIMAALVTSNEAALAVAFAHLAFNICGIVIFLPLAKIPIGIAQRLSGLILKSRLYPIAFIIMLFFVIPIAIIFLLR